MLSSVSRATVLSTVSRATVLSSVSRATHYQSTFVEHARHHKSGFHEFPENCWEGQTKMYGWSKQLHHNWEPSPPTYTPSVMFVCQIEVSSWSDRKIGLILWTIMHYSPVGAAVVVGKVVVVVVVVVVEGVVVAVVVGVVVVVVVVVESPPAVVFWAKDPTTRQMHSICK